MCGWELHAHVFDPESQLPLSFVTPSHRVVVGTHSPFITRRQATRPLTVPVVREHGGSRDEIAYADRYHGSIVYSKGRSPRIDVWRDDDAIALSDAVHKHAYTLWSATRYRRNDFTTPSFYQDVVQTAVRSLSNVDQSWYGDVDRDVVVVPELNAAPAM